MRHTARLALGKEEALRGQDVSEGGTPGHCLAGKTVVSAGKTGKCCWILLRIETTVTRDLPTPSPTLDHTLSP